MDYKYKISFYAVLGHLGQRIIVVPSKNLVIVRTGETYNDTPNNNPIKSGDVYKLVNEAVRINNKITENDTTNTLQ